MSDLTHLTWSRIPPFRGSVRLLSACLVAAALGACVSTPGPDPTPAPDAREPAAEAQVQPEQVDELELRATAERGLRAEAAWLAEADLEQSARRDLEGALAAVQVAVDASDWTDSVRLNEQFLRAAEGWGLMRRSCWLACEKQCAHHLPDNPVAYAACYWGCIVGCNWD